MNPDRRVQKILDFGRLYGLREDDALRALQMAQQTTDPTISITTGVDGSNIKVKRLEPQTDLE